MGQLLHIIRLVDLLTSAFGMIFCALVIYMASVLNSKALQMYRVMLITNAVVDLLYATNTLYSCTTATFGIHKIFMIINNPIVPSTTPQVYLDVGIQLFLIFFSISMLPLQFIYRYGVLRGQPYTMKQMTMAFLIACAMGGWHGALTPFTFSPPSPEYDQTLRDLIELKPNDTLPGYVVGVVDHFGLMSYHFMNIGIIVCLSYGCIVFFMSKTAGTMALTKTSHISNTRNIQKQMALTIGLQALYPMFLVATPAILFTIMAVLGVQVKGLGEIAMSCVHTCPLFNQAVVIMCVPLYRNFIFGCFGLKKTVHPSFTAATGTTDKSLSLVV